MHPLSKTLDRMVGQQIPNFFRLYLNAHAAQACFCLGRMVGEAWYGDAPGRPEFQTFLANSGDEALSGALKLARFAAGREGRPTAGLVLAPSGRLEHFASLDVGDGVRLELIPDLTVADPGTDDVEARAGAAAPPGYVVVFPTGGCTARERVARVLARLAGGAPLVIAAVDRAAFDAYRRDPSLWPAACPPDVVVFDESFVHNQVPFGAFAARKSLYDHWNRPGYSTFHSTTFQPNSVSTLQFLGCLEEDDPGFVAAAAGELDRIGSDPARCKEVLARLYSPALAKTIASLGFDVPDVKAAGHYVTVAGRRIFDGVAGIACSVRGHNPPGYVSEVVGLPAGVDYHEAVRQRLHDLTGLGGFVPAVSGASAVENALRLGLAARFPRDHVLALKGGFGGKTLFALTGTAKPFYREGLGPLYGKVVYVDPFGENALRELESALDAHPVGVVHVELVQAVGGVRAVPERVVRFLDEGRRRWGYALFVDEVQTGMYRTGPFTMARRYGLAPDLTTIGKGASDMVFPFAATLYSDAVGGQAEARTPGLARALRAKADYEFGYRTLLNTLDRARADGLAGRVAESGALFAELLSKALAGRPAVRDVRVFGLLIAIELDLGGSFRRWFKKQAPFLYILNMLLDRSFPMLVGFCQYEPHVLKLTPPLSITPDEIRRACATLGRVLAAPPHGLLPPALGLLARTYVRRKWRNLARRGDRREPAAR